MKKGPLADKVDLLENDLPLLRVRGGPAEEVRGGLGNSRARAIELLGRVASTSDCRNLDGAVGRLLRADFAYVDRDVERVPSR